MPELIIPLPFSSDVPASGLIFPDAEKALIRPVLPVQTHSCNVGVVNSRFDSFPDTDALVTFHRELPIGVRTADCVPIILYASDVNGVAAVHAGWKGTLNGIVDNTLDILFGRGALPENIHVSFGPSISREVYEVSPGLAALFAEAGFGEYISYPDKDKKDAASVRPHLDLQGMNAERLRRRGVPQENIRLSYLCTLTTENDDGGYLFPSYRRDSTSRRLLTTVMLLDSYYLRRERERWANLCRLQPQDSIC